MTGDVLQPAPGVVSKPSPYSVDETVRRFIRIVDSKGMKVFAVIDHSGEAARIGVSMPETKLVIFGSPQAGTPVMLASPLSALDLPLKVLISADADAGTRVSYNAPSYVARRYNLAQELECRLQGIEALTDTLVGETDEARSDSRPEHGAPTDAAQN